MTPTKTIKNKELFGEVELMIEDGCRIELRVKGGSMRTFLRDGRDVVELTKVDKAAIKTGMVVLFRYNGQHILHRIRKIEGDTLHIKGDGNYRQKELCPRREVVAAVSQINRKGKTVAYGSLRWKWLTFISLTKKLIRTLYIDLKRAVKMIMGRK